MARLNSKFWDVIAKKYARDPVANQAAYEKKLEITRQYMHPDMQVAEIGCGTGSTAIAHAPFVAHIDASDLSTKMLQIAKSKATALNINNINFSQVKAEDIKSAPSTYDMVMAHSLLHLLENKEQMISDIYQMLKPGGIFISSTMCAVNQMPAKFILPIGNFLGLLPLVNFFDKQHLLTSITNAGFEIEQQFKPDTGESLFVVAKKPLEAP